MTLAEPAHRVLRVFGPPGVGKTRLIHEAVRRLGEQTRVRYCNDLDVNRRLVQARWLRDAGAIWLILDELRTSDIEQIEPLFRLHADSAARLILIGTSDDGARHDPPLAFALDRLDEDATRRIIAHEFAELGVLEPSPERVAAILHLSENYPWYTVLLARAYAEQPDAIEARDDDAIRWSAGARRVLAGNESEWRSTVEWDREAELRAKCLLVAMMTRDLELDWDDLWEYHGEALAYAIDEVDSWREVAKREKVCRDRQILRQSGASTRRRYVSPNNLARIILNRFFTDPDLGPKLRRYTPEFRGPLLRSPNRSGPASRHQPRAWRVGGARSTRFRGPS
ncbi:MAG: ATP-binding protein [Deltaproteobacteria bacterium]|nr:ATP-binding protein [Deltaproteobacteria bacterium]